MKKNIRHSGSWTRIASDPEICGGEPGVKGTRISVSIILSHLAAGDSSRIILKNFPHIKRNDIQACLEYASYLSTEKIIPA
jgi:uncharacterized protein (DUF433 family)